jgi:hypothetical protein
MFRTTQSNESSNTKETIMATVEKNVASPPNSQKRPGRSLGQAQELTIMAKLKPGGAERLRKLFAEGFTGDRQHITDRMGTVHDLRFVIFDNDTRLLFASTFDGDWDAYIDDFATKVPEEIELLFHETEDWPGIHDPRVKDHIVERQVTASAFYSAYPDATVRDIWKALKAKKALNELLDQA